MSARLCLGLAAAMLGGCTTTLTMPPGGQLTAIVMPNCVLICETSISAAQRSINAPQAETVTDSASFSLDQARQLSAPASSSATGD